MKYSLEEILQKIQEGTDLQAINKSLLPEGERELLKRCATVRSFDEQLVNEVLRGDVAGGDSDSVPFQQLITHEFVERVPRSRNVYRLRESVRKSYLQAWWDDEPQSTASGRREMPEALRKLSGRLVTYYRKLGEQATPDLLYHLLADNETRAHEFFNKLYGEADRRFDLSRCFDLLNILEERLDILNPDLAMALSDRRIYFQARSFWADEYYQTAYFYERKVLSEAFEKLLQNDAKWILQLYATGGMGKTIFLRWAVSRRCVPAPARIPCARIDFDFIDPVTATREPWLLFLRIADQLNRQIPEAPFSELIDELGEYSELLTRQESTRRNVTATESSPQTRSLPWERLGQEVPDRFVSALREANLAKPVILIFDTLEEILLHQETNILALVEKTTWLREQFPNFRLILSGRYNLMERIPGFSEKFAGQAESLSVEPFTDEEARGYLKHKRGFEGKRPLNAVIQRSNGNPFKLALFADILQSNSRITAREIYAYPEVDLIYLIERVVERIRNGQVQWLLRYGVVPRRLTRSFVEEVMAKYLPPAMAGAADFDDPHSDLPPELQKDHLFRTDLLQSPDEDIDFNHLWQRLSQYASRYAWVSLAGDDAQTLVFHGEVINPMRRLLQRQKVFKMLHRDAIAHFERKAEQESQRWTEWMREAIYHQFQLQGAPAAKYWRRQLEKARQSGDTRRKRELALEVVRTEYVDANGEPIIREDSTRMIDYNTLIEAHYEIARCDVEIARTIQAEPRDRLWKEADYHCSRSDILQKKLRRRIVPRGKIALIMAAVRRNEARYEESLQILKAALGKTRKAADRMELEIEIADVLSLLNRADALQYYESARMRAQKLNETEVLRDIHIKLGMRYETLDGFEEAAKEYQEALRLAEYQRNFTGRPELVLQMAQLALKSGAYDAARDFAYDRTIFAEKTLPEAGAEFLTRLRLYRTRAEIWLALNQPTRALEVCRQFHNIETPDVNVHSLEMRGRALASLMEYQQALEDLENARNLWRKMGSMEGTLRCLKSKIELWLRDIGNLREAESLLDDANRLTMEPGSEMWIALQLLRFEWLNHSGERSKARQIIESLLSQTYRPRYQAGIALEGLIAGSGGDNEKMAVYLDQFVSALEQMRPETLPLTLTDRLRQCPSLDDMPANYRSRVEKFFKKFAGEQPASNIHAHALGEFFRFFGPSDKAQVWLERAIKNASGEQNLFALRKILKTADYLEWHPGQLDSSSKLIRELLSALKEYPMLRSVIYLEHAERLFNRERLDEAESILNEIKSYFTSESLPTQWSARFMALMARLTGGKQQRERYESYMRRAISVYDQLGDKLAVEGLEAELAEPGDRDDAAAFEDNIPGEVVNIYTIRVERLDDNTINVEAKFPGFREDASPAKAVSSKEDRILRDIMDTRSDEVYSYRFMKDFIVKWREMGEKMTASLLAPGALDRLKQPHNTPVDLQLILPDVRFSAVPWEFLRIPGAPEGFLSQAPAIRYFYRGIPRTLPRVEETRWLQSSLNRLLSLDMITDGIFGPRTREALRMFQRDAGLKEDGIAGINTRAKLKEMLRAQETRPGTRVLVLRPSLESESRVTRGTQIQGLDVARIYENAGIPIANLEDPHYDQIVEVVKSEFPEVIHISAALRESPALGGIYLDFTGETGYRKAAKMAPDSSTTFTASLITHMLSSFYPPDRPRPLLILDIASPPGSTELLRQLFLRNAFAREIFQLGSAPAILATGLGKYELQGKLTWKLIEGLVQGESLGRIAAEVRRQASGDQLERLLPFIGTALFADDPHHVPL